MPIGREHQAIWAIIFPLLLLVQISSGFGSAINRIRVTSYERHGVSKLPATRQYVQQLVHAKTRQNGKVSYYWIFVWESHRSPVDSLRNEKWPLVFVPIITMITGPIWASYGWDIKALVINRIMEARGPRRDNKSPWRDIKTLRRYKKSPCRKYSLPRRGDILSCPVDLSSRSREIKWYFLVAAHSCRRHSVSVLSCIQQCLMATV